MFSENLVHPAQPNQTKPNISIVAITQLIFKLNISNGSTSRQNSHTIPYTTKQNQIKS